jgi:DNA-binding CsgD family transcriptional regulator
MDRSAVAEPGALLEREREVERVRATLKAVGRRAGGGTNREIAQTLFVTEKTVETHLGRAFRKLSISSRRQLSDVLASTAS